MYHRASGLVACTTQQESAASPAEARVSSLCLASHRGAAWRLAVGAAAPPTLILAALPCSNLWRRRPPPRARPPRDPWQRRRRRGVASTCRHEASLGGSCRRFLRQKSVCRRRFATGCVAPGRRGAAFRLTRRSQQIMLIYRKDLRLLTTQRRPPPHAAHPPPTHPHAYTLPRLPAGMNRKGGRHGGSQAGVEASVALTRWRSGRRSGGGWR